MNFPDLEAEVDKCRAALSAAMDKLLGPLLALKTGSGATPNVRFGLLSTTSKRSGTLAAD